MTVFNMTKNGKRKLFRRAVVFAVCLAVLALLGVAANAETTVVTKATTHAGIDWGHGVTTDVILEWAVKIGISMAVIFVSAGISIGLVSEKKDDKERRK